MKHKCCRALVTGGAGFIGSHIVDALLQRDFEVKALDDLSSGRRENISTHIGKSGFHLIKGDIRDLETVKEAVKDVEVVFHEAAFVSAGESVSKPLQVYETNVTGTVNLLEASLRTGVKRFILASSAAIYGEHETMPIGEDSAPDPKSPYAVSKLAAELYAKMYHRTCGLETVCLRYFNVYGPRQTSGPYAGVITAFVASLARNRPPVVYGDGSQTRDFINIKDVVDANMLAMEANCAGEAFNVATGSCVTIDDLFRILRTMMRRGEIEPTHEAWRPGDIRRSCGDVSKAGRILGFSPKVALKDGLETYVKQYMRESQQHS